METRTNAELQCTCRTTDAMLFISICWRHSIKFRSQAASLNDDALGEHACPLTFAATPSRLGLPPRPDRASSIDFYLLLCTLYIYRSVVYVCRRFVVDIGDSVALLAASIDFYTRLSCYNGRGCISDTHVM